MKLKFAALMAGLAALLATTSAHALPHEGEKFWEERPARQTRMNREYRQNRVKVASLGRESYSGGAGPRPGRWCGWWMRTQLGGGPELNLARNWARWGSNAGGPQVGAVVVWSGHVGMITGRASNGQWIVKSGNDGGAVRERARSVSGAIAFRVG